MRKLKVSFVLPSLHGGGAERAAVTILNGLPADSYERTLYLFRRDGAYLDDVAPDVRLIAGSDGSRAERLAGLRRFFTASGPDIVVSFLSYFSVFVAARWARLAGRIVINQQTPMTGFLEDHDYRWRYPLRRRAFALAARTVYPRVDAVAVTSRGVAEDLVLNFRVPPGKIRVLHNPVDLDGIVSKAHEPIGDDDLIRARGPIVVSAGRLAAAKNFPLFIEAVRLLQTRVPVEVFILGQGEQEAQLRLAIERASLGDVVHLCGFQTNPWRYMARADVFVLTSRYEGFGNVLIEAMTCGTPVVATASPGTREIIESGVNGLLVDRHDAQSVAAAIHQVLTDAALRSRLVSNGRVSAARFSVPHVVAEYDAMFRELTA